MAIAHAPESRPPVCRSSACRPPACAPLPVWPSCGSCRSTSSCALLGQPPRSTFFAWRKHPESARLPRDTLERLSNLLGIYKSLQILLPDAAKADAWVRQPNTAAPFGGRSALQCMLAGNVSDLNQVRRYLDAVRGGGWS